MVVVVMVVRLRVSVMLRMVVVAVVVEVTVETVKRYNQPKRLSDAECSALDDCVCKCCRQWPNQPRWSVCLHLFHLFASMSVCPVIR